MSNNRAPSKILNAISKTNPKKIQLNENGTIVITDPDLATELTSIAFPDGAPEGGEPGSCNAYCPQT